MVHSGNQGLISAELQSGTEYLTSGMADANITTVVVLEALPIISIAEIGPVDESTGEFDVTLTSNIQLVAGHDLTITTLTVVDATTNAPQYAPVINPNSLPITITSSSFENSVNVNITFTAVSGYHRWADLTVSLASDTEYTADINANSRTVTIAPEEPASRTVAIDAPVSVG